MMAITHACIATAGTSLIFSTADPLTLGLAVIGSQLPDLDSTESVIGQICFPISSRIENRFPHRTITHSLLATVALAALSVGIALLSFLGGLALGNVWMLAALPLGHVLSCFSDTFTRQGVQLFWPEPVWAVSVSNPNRRLTTGGTGEYWVLAGAIALLILGITLAGGGGLTSAVGTGLGLRDSAIETYNENAATHQVYANVQGVWASDRRPADGRYLILENDGNEFLLTDGRGLYRTGEQIIVNKLTTEIGAVATTVIQTVNFSDEPALPKLQELQAAYPNAEIYLSGAIAIDFPEEIQIPIDPKTYQTASIAGESLTLDHHPLEQAVLMLREQYVLGTVQAKVFQ